MSNGSGVPIYTPGNLSADQIRAHGEFRTRIAIIWLVGVLCGGLALGGIIAFFIKPESSKDLWVIIGPIISAGVSGTVGFFAGERKSH